MAIARSEHANLINLEQTVKHPICKAHSSLPYLPFTHCTVVLQPQKTPIKKKRILRKTAAADQTHYR